MHGITTSDPKSYDAAYDSYIAQNHKQRFGSWQLYERARAVHHWLERYSILETFSEMFSTHTDFLNSELNSERAVATIHDMFSLLVASFDSYMSDDILGIMMLEMVKFAVGTSND